MAVKRIPATAINAGEPYQDGDLVTGEMVNQVVKVLKDGVNYNKFFIDAMFSGTTEEAIVIGVPKGTNNNSAEDIAHLVSYITSAGIPVEEGKKAFIFRCVYEDVDDNVDTPPEITGVVALNYYKYISNAWVHQYAVSMDNFIQGLSSDFNVYNELTTLDDDDLFVVKDNSASVPKKITKLNLKETIGVDALDQRVDDVLEGTIPFTEIKVDDGLGNFARILYQHTNGNNYQVLKVIYPDGREEEMNETTVVNYRNESGTTLNSGRFLMTDGLSTGNQAVRGILFDPTSQHASKFLGVVTVDGVGAYQKSKATRFGIVHGIPTYAFRLSQTPYAEGQYLWGTSDGWLSNEAPIKPALQINVGIIINLVGGVADVLVCPVVYGRLRELSDMAITPSATNGDLLVYQEGVWRNSQRLVEAENEITKIKDGTTTVKKAEQDKNGNDIVTTYETKADATSKLATKVDKTTTIIGLDLQDNILIGEFRTALGNATQSVAGLLSAEDKTHLDSLVALLENSDGDTIVDTIGEILAIFQNYPEGADLVTVLQGKVDKVAGKGLSTNDFTDLLKAKLDSLLDGTQYYDKTYIDALKDQNGWESELLTLTPITTGGSIAKSILQGFDVIKLFARNTATNEIDTDSFETSVGLVDGYEYRLFDNANIKFVIGTSCVFTDTVGGYTLSVIGQKYTDLVASDVSTDEVGVSVQDKLDDLDVKKANRYIDEPIAELNNHTLREVFEGGNLVVNGDFNNISGWTFSNVTIENRKAFMNVPISSNGALRQSGIITSSTDMYYLVYDVETVNGGYRIDFGTQVSMIPSLNGTQLKRSHFITSNSIGDLSFNRYSSTQLNQIYFDNIFLVNRTLLGISSLTVEQMDYWYSVYMQYKDDNGLKSTVDSLQALKEKDSEIELKVTTIEEAYRKSQNGELTATKFDTDNISLGKDVAPAPLQVKVDGGLLEAKQLVVNGDFSNGTTGWSFTRVEQTIENQALKITATSEVGSHYTQQVLTPNYLPIVSNTYYLSFEIKELNNNVTAYIYNQKSDGSFENTQLYITENGTYSIELTISSIYSTPTFYVRFALLNTSDYAIIDNVYMFNKSPLIANKTYSPLYNKTFDLMSDAEIKAQMDLWVQNGTLPNDNVLAVGMNKRVRSVGKNLFGGKWEIGDISPSDGSNVSSTTAIRTDFIRVKPSTAYVKSSTTNGRHWFYDVNKNYISNDVTASWTTPSNAFYMKFRFASTNDLSYQFQLELGSTATSYVPYANTDLYLQANKVGYKLPNGVADTVEYRNGKYYYVQRVQRYVLQASDITALLTTLTNVDRITVNYNVLSGVTALTGAVERKTFVNRFPNEVGATVALYDQISSIGSHTVSESVFYLIIAKGTYANLSEAQTALTGTVVYYQLATPIETEILALGNAQGLAGGTTYIDDIMADSNLYTSKYDIENTAYPIKSLDRIVKINADGSQTELAVSSATIAGDGLSFTHPSLVANDIVWIAYAYNVANLFKSNTFVTYYDSPFYLEDWITPTLTNSWVAFDTARTPKYRKNTFGFVTIKGIAKGGTVGQPIFTLPSGYRPLQSMLVASVSANAFVVLSILSTGVVAIYSGSNASVSLDCSFYID